MRKNLNPANVCEAWDLTKDELERFYEGCGRGYVILNAEHEIVKAVYFDENNTKNIPINGIKGIFSACQFCPDSQINEEILMPINITAQYKVAFKNITAYVIFDKNSSPLGTIAFKFPKDKTDRLYCYLSLAGEDIIRGYASGYFLDKESDAFADAIHKLPADNTEAAKDLKDILKDILGAVESSNWRKALEKNWYQIFQAL